MSIYPKLRENPDFFSNVYTYFARGGYLCIVIENVLHMLLLAFTLIFVTFSCFFLNWSKIGKCDSETTCDSISHYIINPISFHTVSVSTCMIIFIIMFLIYWSWISTQLIKEILKFSSYKSYFNYCLKIKDKLLKILSWNDIINSMIEYDNELTPDIIVGSIMRKENYLIALISLGLLKKKPIYYTNTYLLLVNVGYLNRIFVEDPLTIDCDKLKKSSKIIAALTLLLTPFTLVIFVVHYLVSFTTEIYTKKSNFGPKEWTIYAKYMFREYNELPHIFNDRIIKSYKYAIQYEQKFNAHLTNIIMEKIIYIAGAYLTLLLLMTLYDDRILMYISLFGRNLIWYVAILTSCISLARMMSVYPSLIDESSDEIMQKIYLYTHYDTNKYVRTGSFKTVQIKQFSIFKKLYIYKIYNGLIEIITILLLPYYIYFKFSDDIDTIHTFVSRSTVNHPKIGYVCKYSLINNQDSSNISSKEEDMLLNQNDQFNYDKEKRSYDNFIKYYNNGGHTVEEKIDIFF